MTLPVNPGSGWDLDTVPDWWRYKEGWEKVQARFHNWLDELLALEKELMKLRRMDARGFKQARGEFLIKFHRQELAYRRIERQLKEAEKRAMEWQGRMKKAEDAIQRGIRALTPEEWHNLRQRLRQQVIRTMERPKRPPRINNSPICKWEDCGLHSWGRNGYCGPHAKRIKREAAGTNGLSSMQP